MSGINYTDSNSRPACSVIYKGQVTNIGGYIGASVSGTTLTISNTNPSFYASYCITVSEV